MKEFPLVFLDRYLAICKLPPDTALPEWAEVSDLLGYIRTPYELTLICDEDVVPADITYEGGWCPIYIDAILEFDLVGVLSAILNQLAAVGIPIFSLSTYSTDFILIRCDKRDLAEQVLTQAGYNITNMD